jgi:hypothetical protein
VDIRGDCSMLKFARSGNDNPQDFFWLVRTDNMLARKATRLLSSAESSKRSLTTRGSPFGRSKPSSGLMSSGLLGLPNVKTPRDWQRSAAQTINVCEGFIEDLVKNKSNDPVEVRPFFG